MMAAWKIGPALAAGNTVVLKPSDTTPVSTVMLAELAGQIFPAGVFNVICGDRDTGRALVSHPIPQLVAITGSVRAGREVARAAAQDLKRVHLELGGKAPVTFATATAKGTTGRWWTPAYRTAWSSFLHSLASRYDGNALIRSVAVSSCATLTAEPFVQSPSLALHDTLFAAGWSSAAQQRCLQGAFADYSGWKRTSIDYAFNPFSSYTPGKAAGTQDLAFTYQVMANCANLRRTAGRTCILSNHDFTVTAPTTSRSAPVYAEIKALYDKHPTPVDLQTGPPDNFGGGQSGNLALSQDAQSRELWPPAANPKGLKGFTA